MDKLIEISTKVLTASAVLFCIFAISALSKLIYIFLTAPVSSIIPFLH
jgi:hypothetical protein